MIPVSHVRMKISAIQLWNFYDESHENEVFLIVLGDIFDKIKKCILSFDLLENLWSCELNVKVYGG